MAAWSQINACQLLITVKKISDTLLQKQDELIHTWKTKREQTKTRNKKKTNEEKKAKGN